MYAITGATGKLGLQVIASLLKRIAPDEIVALVRDPAKAADLKALGILVRPFDYDAPGQLASSMTGVNRLLFISSSAFDRIEQHRAVINAAASVAPALIAYTSIIHADTNPMPLAKSHLETERMIAESGLSYAILRNSWYIENYLNGADAAIARGVLLGSSGDGAISAATRADYAEAAAAILTGKVGERRTYELAGDEAFTMADVATVLSEAAGHRVRYQNMAEADFRDALVTAGIASPLAAAMAEYSAKAASGILADDSRTLSDLIGRPTETMRNTLLGALRIPKS